MISVDFHEDINTTIITFSNPYDPMQDTMGSMQELTQRLEANDKDLHYIADLTHINVSFTELVSGLAQAFATPGNVFSNPRVKLYTVLGADEIVQLGASAVTQQDQYGKIPMKLFGSVEEALEDVRN